MGRCVHEVEVRGAAADNVRCGFCLWIFAEGVVVGLKVW